MEIKDIAISAKVVIESLVCLLENENVDLSSIKFKVGSASEGYESPDMEFGKLIDIALDGLVELKENPTKVPEGFVLVSIEPTQEMYRAFQDGFNNAQAGNTAQNFKVGYKAMIEAQGKSHD